MEALIVLLTLIILAGLGIVIYGIIKVASLSSQISLLDWELKKLQNELNTFRSSDPKPIPQPSPPPPPSSAPEKESFWTLPKPIDEEIPTVEDPRQQKQKIDWRPPAPRAIPQPKAEKIPLVEEPEQEEQEINWRPPTPIRPEPATPSRTNAEWEALVGGKLLNRIGALALIIGIGFFLKYAFDNNWISETVRVLIGIAVGAGLLYTATRTYEKGFKVFSQGLVGSGIAILYLSIYASFNYYHLVSQFIAFGLMAVITAISFLQAFKYNSIAVSLLGWAGGFLTPILLNTGVANEIGLFTYIALLDVGVVSVVLLKPKWIILETLSLLATYFLYFSWNVKYFSDGYASVSRYASALPSNLVPTIFFLTVFWFIFSGMEYWRSYTKQPGLLELRGVLESFSLILYWVSLFQAIDPHHHAAMGLVTLYVGAVYLGSALSLEWKTGKENPIISQHIISAIILLAVATCIQFTGLAIVRYWSAEALGLLFCAAYWKRSYVWKTALALYAVTIITLLFTDNSLSITEMAKYTPVFNLRALTYLMVIAACYGGTLLMQDNDEELTYKIRTGFHYAWASVLFILCLIETKDYFEKLIYAQPASMFGDVAFHETLSLAIVSMMYAILMMWRGLTKSLVPLMLCATGAYFISMLITLFGGISYSPIHDFTLLINIRMLVFLLIIGSSMVLLKLVQPNNHILMFKVFIRTIQIGIIALIFVLLTGETADFFRQKMTLSNTSAQQDDLSNLLQMSLSVVWLLYSIVLIGIGIWKQLRELRILAIILFGFTILKIFMYDLSFLQTLYRIFSFVVLGLILLLVSYLYQRYKDLIFGERKKEEEPNDTEP